MARFENKSDMNEYRTCSNGIINRVRNLLEPVYLTVKKIVV